jgi:hypothetical protein
VDGLEAALGWVEENIDGKGRVWSDVYYEDQVIKDGRTAQAQAFSARAFGLAAEIESRLNRTAQAARYTTISQQLAAAMVAPLPVGFWDGSKQRFVDWVDRLGQTHDHIHLLANVLPPAFGCEKRAWFFCSFLFLPDFLAFAASPSLYIMMPNWPLSLKQQE